VTEDELAQLIAEEIVRQDGRPLDLSGGELTEFMVFSPINLVLVARAITASRDVHP
jgi:hypothetical protein